MDTFDEHISNSLSKFKVFAGQFTKVVTPIVDTAIKMSSEEPVSAYSVLKAAKELANANKKPKKNQNAGKKKGKAKGAKKGGGGSVKTMSYRPAGVGATKAAKNNNNNKSKVSGALKKASLVIEGKTQAAESKNSNAGDKKPNAKDSHKKGNATNFDDSEVFDLVENLYTVNPKKLSKSEQKKKKDLEDYLVKQLERDDNMLGDDDESFDSEGSEEEEGSYSSSDASSDEYTLNESGSYSEKSLSYDQLSSGNEEGDKAAEDLVQAILSKANKKRKSPDTTQNKSKDTVVNATLESKKPKRGEEIAKPASRKSFPISAKKEKADGNPNRRSSLAAVEEKISLLSKAPNKITTSANVKLEPLSTPTNVVKMNSIEEGKRAFKWLLNPVSVDDFFSKYWEQKACLIKRQQTNYFKHLISFEAIDQMLLKNHVEFTKNIDVTSYKNGKRETLNPEGRALPPVVWDHYGQGCSLRLLNPQTFLSGLFTLNTTLQEYFHCLVGANAYLTPPNSQGFAPHYDDIEAFVLQVEGRKRWKLYKPRSTAEILPRFSSTNFKQQEIGKPVLEEVLEPGDVLYFPRGTIHQACTEPGYHSLHITLSVYQKQSFADLFEEMVPLMLKKAIASNVDLRRGLPLNAWQNAGIAFNDNGTKERADLTKRVSQLMQKCMRELPLENIMDSAIDQVAKKFQREALPPEILPAEKLRTVFGSRSQVNERGECVCDYDIDERTNVRLLRANILRLVEEEEKIRIYYYLDNSKQYCEYEPNFIEIEGSEAASVEVLIKSYPQYVGVSQLPLPSDEQKVTLVTALWERGLLMMEKPFK